MTDITQLSAATQLRQMKTWESTQALCGNLMAAEDLSVVFDANIKHPAHIDIKSRIVRIAQLVPEQAHLIPGLIAHEISHALHTDPRVKITQILNIVEDGYIERKIVKKFPGAKKHLRIVFDEFFSPEDADKGSLVVRILNVINYNCKGIKFGKLLDYPEEVTPEDKKFFQNEVEMLDLPTTAERNEVAEEVKSRLKKYGSTGDESSSQQGDGHDSNDDSESDNDDSVSDGDGDGDSNTEDDNVNSDSKSSSGKDSKNDEGSDENGEDSDESGDGKQGSNGELDSAAPNPEEDWLEKELTDDQNGKLNDHHKKFNTIGETHEDLWIEIASPEAVVARSNFADIIDNIDNTYKGLGQTKSQRGYKNLHVNYSQDLEKARKTARIMYQQFQLRKNAHEMAATRYESTGAIDVTRLPFYQLDENIFGSRRITPDGVNHAIALELDWSGSMSGSTMELWRRTAEFVEFAKLAGVRVIVHTYTTGGKSIGRENQGKFGKMIISPSNFIKIIDTGACNTIELGTRLKGFWDLCSGRLRNNAQYGMSGTTILEGHAHGIAVLKNVPAHRKSVIVVSDGGDGTWGDFVENSNDYIYDQEFTPVHNGKQLPNLGLDIAWNTGPRQQALLSQVRSAKEIGINTVGIFLGSLNLAATRAAQAPYDGNFITWGNLGKGNAFIKELMKEIGEGVNAKIVP